MNCSWRETPKISLDHLCMSLCLAPKVYGSKLRRRRMDKTWNPKYYSLTPRQETTSEAARALGLRATVYCTGSTWPLPEVAMRDASNWARPSIWNPCAHFLSANLDERSFFLNGFVGWPNAQTSNSLTLLKPTMAWWDVTAQDFFSAKSGHWSGPYVAIQADLTGVQPH